MVNDIDIYNILPRTKEQAMRVAELAGAANASKVDVSDAITRIEQRCYAGEFPGVVVRDDVTYGGKGSTAFWVDGHKTIDQKTVDDLFNALVVMPTVRNVRIEVSDKGKTVTYQWISTPH